MRNTGGQEWQTTFNNMSHPNRWQLSDIRKLKTQYVLWSVKKMSSRVIHSQYLSCLLDIWGTIKPKAISVSSMLSAHIFEMHQDTNLPSVYWTDQQCKGLLSYHPQINSFCSHKFPMTTGGVSPHIPRMLIKGVRAMVSPSPRNPKPNMEEFSSNASWFASQQLSKFLSSRMPLI